MKILAAAALVVGLAVNAFAQTQDRIVTGSLGPGNNTAVAIPLAGYAGVGVVLTTADLNATVLAEISYDGTSWRASAFLATDASAVASIAFTGVPQSEYRGILITGGASHARVRVNPYTAGSATVVLRATASLGNVIFTPVGGGAGGDGAINDGVSSAIKATVKDYTNSNPLTVVTVDTNGDPVSAGAGVQYTEGDVDATITGTAAMMEVAANTLQPFQGTVADGLLVNLGANNDVTVTSSALPTGAATEATVNSLLKPASTLTGVTTVGTVTTITNPVTVTPAAITSANNDGACVSVTTTSGTVLASFATRAFAAVCSRVTNTDLIYLKLAATATTSDYPLEIGQCFNLAGTKVYSGVIDARSNTGTQSACVVEW